MSDESQLHFREIFKYGWLRLLPPEEKKIPSLPKKVWVVFCIHDEKLPYLEIYSDKKIAIMHKPDVSYALKDTLHVSPTICPLEGEHEFVVTLSSVPVRLVAPSWNQMSGWIDGISSKLREMKILLPKENFYMTHLPEVRPPLLPTRDPNSPLPLPPNSHTYIPPGVEPVNNITSHEGTGAEVDINNSRVTPRTTLTSRLRLTQEQMTRQTVVVDVDLDASNDILSNYSGRIGNGTVIEVPAEYLPFDMFDLNAITDILRHLDNNNTNTTSTSSSSEQISTSTTQVIANSDSYVHVDNVLDNNSHPSTIDQANTNNNSSPTNEQSEEILSAADTVSSTTTDMQSESPVIHETSSSQFTTNEQLIDADKLVPSVYEHLFVASPVSTSSSILTVNDIRHSPTTSQLPRMGRGRGHARGRRRNYINGESNCSGSIAFGADRIRTASMPISSRLQPAPHPFGGPLATANNLALTNNNNQQPTLREQQVMQLRREMAHSAGVRLQLRKKDCIGSIAFVDAFQAVWIAGWKQKEHPMLYNALHIGDQLLSVGGKVVMNASDAQKIIRAWPSLYLEFVIRRVPCGRVFAIRRECDGQPLGIVQNGNTAEIREVMPDSVAALQGLSLRAPSMDGLGFTTWVLTEINARPLNLFFKDNEVKDRLNAVGLDISLLVQPFDLIKQIKKQLKNIKNYKEYIVQ